VRVGFGGLQNRSSEQCAFFRGARKSSKMSLDFRNGELIHNNFPWIPYGRAPTKMQRQECPLFLGRVKTFLFLCGLALKEPDGKIHVGSASNEKPTEESDVLTQLNCSGPDSAMLAIGLRYRFLYRPGRFGPTPP